MTKKSEENINMEERKSKITSWANGLNVVCIIERAFLYLGIFSLLLVLLFTPKLSNKIKVTDNSITIFNEKIKYEVHDSDILTIKHKGKDYKINSKNVINPIIKALKNFNFGKLSSLIIVGISMVIISMILTVVILIKVSKLLKGIKQEEKVFIKDGHKQILHITFLNIAILVVECIGSIVINILLGANSTGLNLNVSSIITILAIYFVSLIYEYGERLEEK